MMAESEVINFDSNRVGKVVLSNKLAEAESNLTSLEFKIVMMMASLLEYNTERFRPVRLKVEEYIKICKLNGESAYSNLKESALSLLGKKLIIKEKDSELHTHWVTSVKTYKKKGYIDACFHPELEPYLLQLRQEFTIAELEYILVKIKSVYSAKIYILMKQYLSRGEREIEIDKLKRILGVMFIVEEEVEGKKVEKIKDKYKNFSDFEKNVLLPSKVEISEKTDLIISYEITGKERKKATRLTFTIELKEDASEKVIVDETDKQPDKENNQDNKGLEAGNDKPSDKKGDKLKGPTLQEILDYCRAENYHTTYDKFFKYYSPDWKDGQDKPVKNWKKKLQVWANDKKNYALLPKEESEVKTKPEPEIELTEEQKAFWQEFWQDFNITLREEFGDSIFDKWLSKINLHSVKDNEIILAAESKFLRDWIKKEYLNNGGKSGKGIKQICQEKNPALKNVWVIYSPELITTN